MNPAPHARRRDDRKRATVPPEALATLWPLAFLMDAAWLRRYGDVGPRAYPGHAAMSIMLLTIGVWPTDETEQRRLACFLDALHETGHELAPLLTQRAHALERAATKPPAGIAEEANA